MEYKGKACPVLKVVRGRAFIKEGDKLVSVAPGRSVLVSQPEFLPYFVAVRNLEVKTSYLTSVQMAGEMNNEFHFNATFESSYRMENPFLVLELDMEKSGKRIFFQEIGPLAPGHPEWVRVVVALPDRLGPGKFKLHIFSDGLEVLHSQQPEAYREAVLNKMVAKRIAGVQDAPPRPFVGPVPEYPAALRKKRVEGEAVVAMRITPPGRRNRSGGPVRHRSRLRRSGLGRRPPVALSSPGEGRQAGGGAGGDAVQFRAAGRKVIAGCPSRWAFGVQLVCEMHPPPNRHASRIDFRSLRIVDFSPHNSCSSPDRERVRTARCHWINASAMIFETSASLRP